MDTPVINPTDLRQFSYCPRVVYFTYCTPIARRETWDMQQGKEVHAREIQLEQHRTLKRYGLLSGRREFGVRLYSETLGLSGVADMVVHTPEGIYPIEFKNTENTVQETHKIQLCAYGLLLEEHYGQPISKGYWYSLYTRTIVEVPFDAALQKKTHAVRQKILKLLKTEVFPEPAHSSKCYACELKNFCGDVV